MPGSRRRLQKVDLVYGEISETIAFGGEEFLINEAKELGEACLLNHLNTLPGFPTGIELNTGPGGTQFFSRSTYETMNNPFSLLISIIQPLRSLKH
jgi:hypothetical protein